MKKMQYLQRCIFQKFGNHLLIVFHLETYKPGKRFSSHKLSSSKLSLRHGGKSQKLKEN